MPKKAKLSMASRRDEHPPSRRAARQTRHVNDFAIAALIGELSKPTLLWRNLLDHSSNFELNTGESRTYAMLWHVARHWRDPAWETLHN
jgi:hypothetical protein